MNPTVNPTPHETASREPYGEPYTPLSSDASAAVVAQQLTQRHAMKVSCEPYGDPYNPQSSDTSAAVVCELSQRCLLKVQPQTKPGWPAEAPQQANGSDSRNTTQNDTPRDLNQSQALAQQAAVVVSQQLTQQHVVKAQPHTLTG